MLKQEWNRLSTSLTYTHMGESTGKRCRIIPLSTLIYTRTIFFTLPYLSYQAVCFRYFPMTLNFPDPGSNPPVYYPRGVISQVIFSPIPIVFMLRPILVGWRGVVWVLPSSLHIGALHLFSSCPSLPLVPCWLNPDMLSLVCGRPSPQVRVYFDLALLDGSLGTPWPPGGWYRDTGVGRYSSMTIYSLVGVPSSKNAELNSSPYVSGS